MEVCSRGHFGISVSENVYTYPIVVDGELTYLYMGSMGVKTSYVKLIPMKGN